MNATYICPEGHRIISSDVPKCPTCELIATRFNAKTGEVFTWTPIHEHEADCEALQDQMDAAFDNQYFSGGW